MKILKKLSADCVTPVSLYFRLTGESKCLLESIPRDSETNRYSLIAFNPVHHIQFLDNEFYFDDTHYACADPLKELERYVLKDEPMEGLPFEGGAIGYVGYDIAALYEDLGTIPEDALGLPDMQFYLFETFVIYDHQQQTLNIVASDLYSQCGEEVLKERVAKIEAEIFTLQKEENQPLEPIKLSFTSNFTQAEYEAVVEQAKQYIREGDLFQVVPSQRLSADFPVEPFHYYRHLRVTNPSAYLYYLPFPEVTVIGSSPESLVRVKGDTVTTNPIAGTRRRGLNEIEDDGLAEELLTDEKEIAEHQMLIDLGRNDIGKVSEIGSVHVPLFMTIERYRFVMHIVSLVEGKLRKDQTAMDALKATLPAGTVSGAPKIRAMTRIYEWEPVKRSIYAGAVGYLSCDNQADFAIAIRTMVVKDKKAHVQAGGGVVYDSDPTSEYLETMQKAKALLEVGK
ncbi:anthranilate synthase component I [Enterococcus sp. 669A]|uniref:Anthranilate synthase component 1 n=1 Tax=Candidatus Enterococcus moelleringii TaxID=2815325 RepID=A0ABS3L4R1_9ENTE|nr:anthranilate synthase component I [Enterococcus sp. 669A]MBO1304607.1 anthranilate synthase component I [Enterococcus sp. 669A]